MTDPRLKSNLSLESKLKPNLSLSTLSSMLKTTTATSSTLNSKLLSSSLSSNLKLSSNLGLTSSFGLTDDRKKKSTLSDSNTSLEAKKPKILESSTKPFNLSSNLNLGSLSLTSNQTSLGSSLNYRLTSTSNVAHKTDLLNSSRLLTNPQISSIVKHDSKLVPNTMLKKSQNLQNVATKRPFFHLESQGSIQEEADQKSFIHEEYQKTEALINMINNDYKQVEEEFFIRSKKMRTLAKPAIVDNLTSLSGQKNEIIFKKNALINAVSSSLLREPNFKNPDDATRQTIFKFAESVIQTDPEFILKLALYTRKELNIRVTANFLLCLASFKEQCRPYLQKYFKQSIGLPSDWIDVAEQYQLFVDKRVNFGSLPSALRKCMVEKFPDFDKYQLAKYNKEKSRLAKNKEISDIKHIKSKLKDENNEETEIVDHKFIKMVKGGLKINDRILVEIVANKECKSLKIDIISREEEEEQPKPKGRPQKGRQPEKPKVKGELNDSVACRINIDFEAKSIVLKHFLNKEWTKRSEKLNASKNTDLFTGFDPIFFYIDVNSSKFTLGTIKDEKTQEIGSYLHSKHNIQLLKLNCLRVSGSEIKLKDLKVVSKDKVNYDPQTPGETEKEIKQRSFTLKQLIRQLHISSPIDNVMSLIGKKYPETFEEFMQSKLPGIFDSELAGKRMKLATPETWETQISMKGNKAEVWEQLIDNKKLPYMAMLRNIRNMIKTGISEKHHQWVIKKLQDEGAVVHSKQFPFRFFTAYEVLDELEDEFNKYIVWSQSGQEAYEPPKRGKKKEKPTSDMNYDLEILKRYKTALDNALKVATTFNVSPIKGSTVIFLNLSADMDSYTGKSAKSLGKKITSISQIGSLLALMFKYSCENSKLIIFTNDQIHSDIELEQGTILDNMKSLTQLKSQSIGTKTFPHRVLMDILRTKENYDNLVYVSNGVGDVEFFKQFLRKYRITINENLLFVNVNLASDKVSLTQDSNFDHENDINISGFSDAILRFVAERGNKGQLVHIDNIDKAYDLPELKKKSNKMELDLVDQTSKIEKPRFKLYVPKQEYKTVKVFISSTFRDMHSERDILVKTVFPMLRSKLSSRLINIYEIDMRWGITESEANNNQTLDLCLNQILNSDYFINILGARYGHVSDSYMVRNNPCLNWLNTYPPGASITELEIETQLRKDSDELQERTFFYFRDNSFINQVPEKYHGQFLDNEENSEKLVKLKSKIRSQSYEIFDGYKCKWLKCEESPDGASRALVTDLDLFAHRVFNNLFNAITKHNKNEVFLAELDEINHYNYLNHAFISLNNESFVGREKLLAKFEKILNENKLIEITNTTIDNQKELIKIQNSIVKIFLLNGEAGAGKTSFLCYFISNYIADYHKFVHCVGSFPGSEQITRFLKQFCAVMNRQYSLELDENELKNANNFEFYKKVFEIILIKIDHYLASYRSCNQKFYLIVDGVDCLVDDNNNLNESFNWLPEKIPSRISFIFTARSTSQTKNVLSKISSSNTGVNKIKIEIVDVENLDLMDKSVFVKSQLQKFHKYLDESPFNNQMKLLTSKKDSSNPLYLSLACEELRNHNQFETLSQKLKELPIKINQLVDYVIERLESDFGKDFIQAAFTFICCSRDGLNEQELKNLLELYFAIDELNLFHFINNAPSLFFIDQGTLRNCFSNGLNKISTSKFLSFIETISETFLKPRSSGEFGLIQIKKNNFIENSLRAKYGNKHIAKSDGSFKFSLNLANKLMAIYYWRLIDNEFQSEWSNLNPAGFINLPFHLAQSDCFQDLAIALTDIKFVSNKIELNLVHELMNDFDLHESFKDLNILSIGTSSSFAKKPVKNRADFLTDKNLFYLAERVQDFKLFIASNFHLFATKPNLFYQQAINQPESSLVYISLKEMIRQKSDTTCYSFFELINKSNESQSFNLFPTTLKDFDDSVNSVAISPNGVYVACGTKNCEIRLYSINTASLIRKFQGHSGNINSLKFIGNSVLCSTSADGKACIWSVDGGYRIKVLDKHNSHSVSDCCADQNGKTLITVGWDCTAKIWKPEDGSLQGELKGHHKPINCVNFNPEGNLVITGSWDSCIRIFNLFDRSRKAVLRGHKSSIRSITYSNNGVYIASSSIDGDVKLWNSKYGSTIATLNGHSLPVNSICFSPTSQFLVTGSSDRRVKVWTESVGKMIRVIKNDHFMNKPVTCVSFYQETGELFAVGTHEGLIQLYQTEGILKNQVKAHSAFVKRIKFSNNGNYLVTASDDGTSKIIDVNTFKVVTQLNGTAKSINALAVNKQNVIVTGSEDCNIRIYSTLSDLISKEEPNLSPKNTLNKHSSAVTALSFNSSGNQFASASKDALIIVWSLNFDDSATELYRKNNAHSDWITDLEWSNTSDFFLTASNDFTLKIWNAIDGKEKSVLAGHTSNINSCSFQYGCAVSTSFDGSIKIWSHKGHEITTLKGHQGRVNCCDLFVKIKKTNITLIEDEEEEMLWSDRVDKEELISKNKKSALNKQDFEIESVFLATASDDSTVRLWKPIESDYLLSLENHNDRINSVDLSQSDTLATASSDKSVNLWNMKDFFNNVKSGLYTNNERTIKNHYSEITSICFNKSCTVMLSGSHDGMVLVWKVKYSTVYDSNEMSRNSVTELEFIRELKAHDLACNNIRVIEDSDESCSFVTCSFDNSIKVWKIKDLLEDPSIELVQKINGKDVEQILFIDTISNEDKNYLVSVNLQTSSSIRNSYRIVCISYYIINNGLLEKTKLGLTIMGLTAIVHQVRLIGTKLYFSVVEDAVYEIELNKSFKKMRTIPDINELEENEKQVVKQFTSKSNIDSINQTSEGFNALWYTSLSKKDEHLYAANWKGEIFMLDNDKLNPIKTIHTSRITDLIYFKNDSNLDRFISSCQDGSVKIWSNNFEDELGHFNSSSAITKLVKLPKSDENIFVIGDQMGNLKIVKWYD